MELIRKNINGIEFTFTNNTWSNSNGWGHETRLFQNCCEIGKNRVRYYNRTWECYTYQSCMQGCVYQLIDELEERLKDRFKNEKGINRLTKKYEDEFISYKEQNTTLQNYKELYKSLEWRN